MVDQRNLNYKQICIFGLSFKCNSSRAGREKKKIYFQNVENINY